MSSSVFFCEYQRLEVWLFELFLSIEKTEDIKLGQLLWLKKESKAVHFRLEMKEIGGRSGAPWFLWAQRDWGAKTNEEEKLRGEWNGSAEGANRPEKPQIWGS